VGQVILLRGAKQLLTLRGPKGIRRGPALHDLAVIEDGSVLIRDGIIAEIGTTRRVENLKEARNAIEIPANGGIVMPAFVDPGLHVDLLTGNGSAGHPRKRKKLGVFYTEGLTLMRACMQHGTLTAEVKATGDGDDLRADVSVLRQLSRIGNQPISMVRTWRLDAPFAAQEHLSPAFNQTLKTLISRKLVHSVELATGSDGLLSDSLLAALEQTRIARELQWSGGPAEVLAHVLARSNPSSITCPSTLSAEESAVLSRWPGVVVFAPGREIIQERSDCVRELAASGAGLALASGYHPTRAPSFSMQMTIALANLRLGLAPEAAITAATINAAYAVGCGHLTGSLEFGKRADLLLLSVPDYREIPRRFGINHVGIAIREGNIVLNRTRWKIGT
jgi:imidazolonepropionase